MGDELRSYVKKEHISFDEWNTEYTLWLNKLSERRKKGDSLNGPYCDPDDCYEYYKDLCIFLNKQEEARMNGQFSYSESKEPFGIKVTNKKGEIVFVLHSDQMGFSAPQRNGNHPYDWYLKHKEYNECSRNNVSKWIYYTRTIGCGFIWPKEIKTQDKTWNNHIPFNNVRGRLSCEQDRIDLTLDVIRKFYFGEIGNRPAFSEGKQMYKWLSRFGEGDNGWRNYINFMEFTPFVDDYYIPIGLQITKEEFKNKDAWGSRGDILELVCSLVTKRSKNMISH